MINSSRIRQVYSFVDYLKGGMELNAFIGIDFTGKWKVQIFSKFYCCWQLCEDSYMVMVTIQYKGKYKIKLMLMNVDEARTGVHVKPFFKS